MEEIFDDRLKIFSRKSERFAVIARSGNSSFIRRRRTRPKKRILRQWLKSSLHTASLGVHESSIMNETPTGLPSVFGCWSLMFFPVVIDHVVVVPRESLDSPAPRRNYGNIVSLTKVLQGTEKLGCRFWKYLNSDPNLALQLPPWLGQYHSLLDASY